MGINKSNNEQIHTIEGDSHGETDDNCWSKQKNLKFDRFFGIFRLVEHANQIQRQIIFEFSAVEQHRTYEW